MKKKRIIIMKIKNKNFNLTFKKELKEGIKN